MFSTFMLLLTLLLLSWNFWRKNSSYFAFPYCFFIDWNLIKLMLPKKGWKNKRISHYVFQKYRDMYRKYSNEGMFVLWFLKPVLVVYGPKPYKFFSTETKLADKPEWIYRAYNVFHKNGVFRSCGDQMRKQRKLFRQAFYPSMLKESVSLMNVHATYFVQTLGQLKNNTTDNLEEEVQQNILMLAFESFLGMKPDTPEKKHLLINFIELSSKFMNYAVYTAFRPWLHSRFLMQFFSDGRRYLKIEKEFTDSGKKIVEDLKLLYSSRVQSRNSGQKGRKCFGDILVETHLNDPSFNSDMLRSETSFVIVGGTDTATNCLTWTLWILGHHKEVQEKAFNEIKSLTDEVIRYEDTLKLTYLECVIKESLRCYPVVPCFSRQASQDIRFGKYLVPKGTIVALAPFLLHNNPNMYPDSITFNPESFVESESGVLPLVLPFGEGVRSCLGKTYAMLEMKIYLAYILRHFEIISVTPKKDVRLSWGTMLRSGTPLSVKFIARK